ncbi:TadE/TadG family type IV pilus assembly protein [Streptomyces chattanoogensis]|uniref:TadE/TadG family type IV pilus assembly protein n=1 Tax=Streptomyces chattanoogensis TaxID=66876 RepID=UPI0036A16475
MRRYGGSARRRHWWRQDRGEASIQMAIVFPAVLLLTVAVVQAGLWFVARGIALTAAREGLSAARTYQATPGEGTARAREVLERTSGDLLQATTVRTTAIGGRVRVQVSGRVLSMLPGIDGLQITQSTDGPVERFTSPGD